MKIGDKDYQVKADAARQRVQLQVKVFGLCVAAEDVSPDQARALARLLDQAADAAEARPGTLL
jgi:hypothetical protein